MKFNRKQIIKGLECCYMQELEHDENCPECPYTDMYPECQEQMGKDTLSLIKELAKENKEIEGWASYYLGQYEKRSEEYERLIEEKAKLVEENERLRESECDNCACKLLDERDRARKEVMEIRTNTVRQMQSMIKEECLKGGIWPTFVAGVVERVGKKLLED